MPFGGHPLDVDYLRLFFPEDQEEIAVFLGTLLLLHLGEAEHRIMPEDSIEALIGWKAKPPREIVSFLVAMEEQEVFPKEILSQVGTFRELVEYVAECSCPLATKSVLSNAASSR